jgi:hypothetical protein
MNFFLLPLLVNFILIINGNPTLTISSIYRRNTELKWSDKLNTNKSILAEKKREEWLKKHPVAGFGVGVKDGVVGIVTGVINMIRHPIEFFKGAGYVLTHPIETVGNIYDGYVESAQKKGGSYTAGKMLVDIGSVALPFKGGKLPMEGTISQAVSKVDKVTKAKDAMLANAKNIPFQFTKSTDDIAKSADDIAKSTADIAKSTADIAKIPDDIAKTAAVESTASLSNLDDVAKASKADEFSVKSVKSLGQLRHIASEMGHARAVKSVPATAATGEEGKSEMEENEKLERKAEMEHARAVKGLVAGDDGMMDEIEEYKRLMRKQHQEWPNEEDSTDDDFSGEFLEFSDF